jgi:tRNA pseudouridine38-40 synthase
LNGIPLLTPRAHKWKLTLCYDGTDFKGWQVQPGEATVQGELQQALGRITGESPLPQGSGRTDAGVHALGQVASFALEAPIPTENLRRALNRTLPAAIRVLKAETMPNDFHARHDAMAKTYEYRIFRGETCPPFLARFVYACPWPFDEDAIFSGAEAFLGEHDFLSFAASDSDLSTRVREAEAAGTLHEQPQSGTTVRTVFASSWEERTVEAGRILVYRVRNMVGTMLEAGRGHIRAEDIAGIIAQRSRPAAGPTAPARGLFLHSVEYGPA